MARENRIRIMTAIAVYEKRHREELSDTDQWFRGDYIGVRMLKNGCTFLCFAGDLYQASEFHPEKDRTHSEKEKIIFFVD